MNESLGALVTAIEDYKGMLDAGGEGGENSYLIIRNTIVGVWKALSESEQGINVLLHALERSPYISEGEFNFRTQELRKAFKTGVMGIFGGELLSLFGFTNPVGFLARGTLSPVENPMFQTKIKVIKALLPEKEKKEHPPREGETLEEALSMYETTYNLVSDRQSGVHDIIYDELIPTLAEEAPFIETEKYRDAITWFEKKEGSELHIESLRRRLENLSILVSNLSKEAPISPRIKKSKSRLAHESARYGATVRKLEDSKPDITIEEIIPDIVGKFGFEIGSQKNGRVITRLFPELITSGKIRGRIKRAMSIVIHRTSPELRQLRFHESKLKILKKKYKQIEDAYTVSYSQEEDPVKKQHILQNMKNELDSWEYESNNQLDTFSIKQVRLLRDDIMNKLTSQII